MKMKSRKGKKVHPSRKAQQKLLPSNASAFDEIMEEVDLVLDRKKKPPGRPTVRPNILLGRRDDIAQMLEIEWGKVGWQLQCLRNPVDSPSPEKVRMALEPLQRTHGHERIPFFLRPTSIPATSDEVRSTFVALGKARKQLALVTSGHEAQITNFRDVWRAFYETSEKYRKELKPEIARRMGNVAQLRTECVDKERMMRNLQNQAKVGQELLTAQAQLEKCQEALRGEEEILRGLKDRLGMATNHNRSLVREFARARLKQLRQTKIGRQHRTDEVHRLEKLYEDQSAGFARQDFLTFSVDRRGRHHPRQLANAIAGLPEMGCRQSFTTCQKIPFQRDPHQNFEVFEVIARAWKKRHPNKSKDIADLIDDEITNVPKTREFNGDRVPNYFREYLQTNRRSLEKAIEMCWKLKPRPHPGEVPYIATTIFLENVSRQTSTLERVLSQCSGHNPGT